MHKNQEFTVVVMTTEREPDYFRDLSRQLWEKGIRFEVSTDSKSAPSFQCGEPTPRVFEPIQMYREDWNEHPKGRRAMANYINCLRFYTFGKPVLILEDDVVLSDQFEFYVCRTLELMNAEQKEVCALYACYRDEAAVQNREFKLVDYDVDKFYGTQAMLFMPKAAMDAAYYLESRLYCEENLYDLEMALHWKTINRSLVHTSFSLVQHVGFIRTGLSGSFHQTSTFIDDFFNSNLNQKRGEINA